jgi:NADH-quinone oxidoreductase subunit L
MSFWGKPSPQRPVEHPHEAPLVMLVPVGILAVLATIGGVLQSRALGFGPSAVTDFLSSAVGPLKWEGGVVDVFIGLTTMVLATALFVGALRMRPWSARFPWAQRLLEHKYYFDEIYDRIFVRPVDVSADYSQRGFEKPVIDAAVLNTGWLARASASSLSLTQSGYFRNYVLVFVGGAVVAGAVILLRAS